MRRICAVFGLGMITVLAGSAIGAAPINLGTASAFAVLAGSAVTNTDFSLINGDLGISPETAVSGFPPGTLNGTQYIAEGVALQAKADLVVAYDDAAGRLPVTMIATELGETVLPPGVYNSATGTFGITGTLTLDALNDPAAMFVFQMESSLITASASRVVCTGGAQPCNVHWQVGSSATLGTYSEFVGNIYALTSITVTTGVVIYGRVLARNGAVTLDSDTISTTICDALADDQVYLIPSNPEFPGEQSDYSCVNLAEGFNTQLIVPVNGPNNVPTVTISAGCASCEGGDCEALGAWLLGEWVFNPQNYTYAANMTAGQGSGSGCVCVTLDYVLPVMLAAFDVAPEAQGIRTTFATASEQDNDERFEIMRGDAANGVFDLVATLTPQGNSSTGHYYDHLDEYVTEGEMYWYYLAVVDLSGERVEYRDWMRSATALDDVVPANYSLNVYPNPFNPETSVQFSLVSASDVKLSIYNMTGQWMRDLTSGRYEAGQYTVKFEASELPSGIYFARLNAGVFSQTTKLALLK